MLLRQANTREVVRKVAHAVVVAFLTTSLEEAEGDLSLALRFQAGVNSLSESQRLRQLVPMRF